MLKNIKISTKITVGFATISVLLIIIVMIAIIKVNSVTKINNKVIDLRVPTTMASIEMINGVNHSLAALRGYIILGQDKFKDERSRAWNDEIEPSLKTMIKYSKYWANPQHIEKLRKITLALDDFKRYQKEIENIAHRVENQPALEILFKYAIPESSILAVNISKMIDIELKQPATPKRKALLGMMADVRGTIGLGLANMRSYLISGDKKFKKAFNKCLAKNTKRYTALEENSYLLTKEQKIAFNSFSKAREAFSPLPQKMFEMRDKKNWNLANLWLGTKAAPIAFEIKAELEEMIKYQKQLMQNDIQSAKDASESLITLEWILLIIGLILSIVISVKTKRMIITSINNFQSGLLSFFKYLNKENDSVELLDESVKDEIGVMAKVVNANIHKIQSRMKQDQKIIDDKLSKAQKKADMDKLTQVYNRHKFDEVLEHEIHKATKGKKVFTIAIIDVDNFKIFNDKFGHLTGDSVLITMAETVSRSIRETDTFARWGGEEFVILFKNADIDVAKKVSEKIKNKIEEDEHPEAGKITASFGLSQYKTDDTLETIFKRCDDALYIAKENGRNRVEIL